MYLGQSGLIKRARKAHCILYKNRGLESQSFLMHPDATRPSALRLSEAISTEPDLRSFLQNCKPGEVVPELLEEYDIEAPVLDHTARFTVDGFQWGKHVHSNISSLSKIRSPYEGMHKDFIVNSCLITDEDVSEFIEVLTENFKREMFNIPHSVMSCDIKFIPAVNFQEDGSKRWKSELDYEAEDTTPSMIIFAGSDWISIVHIPITTVLNKDYKINKFIISSEKKINLKLKTFLHEELPTLCGENLPNKLKSVENMINKYFLENEDEFSFKARTLDLPVLALFSGLAIKNPSLNVLYFICGGGVISCDLPPLECRALYAHKWDSLGEIVKDEICIIPIAIYFVMRTLFLANLLHTFPDLSAVAQVSQLSPIRIMKWYSNFMIEFCKNSSALPFVKWPKLSSRTDLLCCIRRCPNTQYRIEKVISCVLTPTWPHLTFGGCRSLYQARIFAIESACHIANPDNGMNFSGSTWIIPERVTENYYLLSLIPKDIWPSIDNLAETNLPTTAIQTLCLPSNFESLVPEGSLIIDDPNTISQRELSEAFKSCAPRTWRILLLEYVLTHPIESRILLERLVEPKWIQGKGFNPRFLHLNQKTADNDARQVYDLIWGTTEMQDNPMKFKQIVKTTANQIKSIEDNAKSMKRKANDKIEEAKKLRSDLEQSVAKFSAVTGALQLHSIPTRIASSLPEPPPFDITKPLETWEEFHKNYPHKSKRFYLKRRKAYLNKL